MNNGIRAALVALAITIPLSAAHSALNQNQVEKLDSLVAAGNVKVLTQWLNQNIGDIDLSSPLGIAVSNFLRRAKQPGAVINSEIISAVRNAAEQY